MSGVFIEKQGQFIYISSFSLINISEIKITNSDLWWV